MVKEPWRYRCPEGHVIKSLGVSTFRCQSCYQQYPKSELVDMKSPETDFASGDD